MLFHDAVTTPVNNERNTKGLVTYRISIYKLSYCAFTLNGRKNPILLPSLLIHTDVVTVSCLLTWIARKLRNYCRNHFILFPGLSLRNISIPLTTLRFSFWGCDQITLALIIVVNAYRPKPVYYVLC
jgi:hypothetical protein